MTARNCIVFLLFLLLACAFPVSAQNNYWQQQQMMRQQQMQQQQEMMRRQQMMQQQMQQQQEMMRRQQMMQRQQQQQRAIQQQRARQASEQARASQQRAIRDQDKRRQFSQRQNMAQKLQQRKALEQNNRLKTRRRLTQQRLVQQKKLQKNRQEQERKNRDIGTLALIGSTSRTSISPQLSQRIQNLTQKSANNNNRTKVSANIKQKGAGFGVSKNNKFGNTGQNNRPPGKKSGSSGSGRPPFKLTKTFNQSAKPLSKDVASRLDSVTKATGKEIGILRDASKGKGNFGLGSGTRNEADKLGKAWVGDGYKVASDGKTLISKDGLRQYRPSSYKPKLGKTQANFEQRLPDQKTKEWHSNGHLDITD